SRIALAGHSLGGLTTLYALAREPRFKAGVMLDATAAAEMPQAVRQPVLSLTAGVGVWDAGECRMWSALQGPHVAVNLAGADHLALSDAVWLIRGAIPTGSLGPEQTVSTVRRYVAGFLDSALRGVDTEPAVSVNRTTQRDAAIPMRAPSGC